MIDEFDLDQDGESKFQGGFENFTNFAVNEQEFIAICTEH